MLGFLAYEGFELIANASNDIIDPKRTLPIAFLGSVIAAISIYTLAFIVAIGHTSFEEIIAAKNFAVSASASSFLGPIGFAIMAAGAILASASAINADYFGAAKLPVMLSLHHELPSAFHRSIRGKSLVSPCYHRHPCPHSCQRARCPRDLGGDERWISSRLRGGQYRRCQACPADGWRTPYTRAGRSPLSRCACSDGYPVLIGPRDGRLGHRCWGHHVDCRSDRGWLQGHGGAGETGIVTPVRVTCGTAACDLICGSWHDLLRRE
jgi:hypothetical protein